MRPRHAYCLLGLWLVFNFLAAQEVHISRMDPGYVQDPSNPLYRIELFNESDKTADLSRYVLMTRYLIFRLPDNTTLGPYSQLRLGRSDAEAPLDIKIQQLSEVKRRIPETREEGDFVALLTPDLEWVDGFYYSPLKQVNFLPAEDQLRTRSGNVLTVALPDEADYRWAFDRNVPDPAMAMVCINGTWKANGRTLNLIQATQYQSINTKFVNGIASIRWITLFEKDCFFHTLERSRDGKNYRPLQLFNGPVNSEKEYEYLAYDPDVEKNQVYYYRVRVTDKFGHTITSAPSRLRTVESNGDFTFDIIRTESIDQRSFDVRFYSRNQQQVRVKLMDEQLREISELYYGMVEADRQNLINYRAELTAGKYYVVVATERRRYYEPIVVE